MLYTMPQILVWLGKIKKIELLDFLYLQSSLVNPLQIALKLHVNLATKCRHFTQMTQLIPCNTT